MAFTDEFQRFVSLVSPSESFVEWLKSEGVLTSQDFALLAASEEKVTTDIIDIAKTSGVEFKGVMASVNVKKLWSLCRANFERETAVRSGKFQEEVDAPIPCETLKGLQEKWFSRHNFRLTPGRTVADSLMNKLFKQVQQRSFSLHLLEKIKTLTSVDKTGYLQIMKEGRALTANEVVSDEVNGYHEFWVRFRALFSSIAFVSIDSPDWFSFSDCEHLCDMILDFLNQKFNKRRASLEFFNNAYLASSNCWVNEVRTNGRTLRDAVNGHASWVHNWTIYNAASFTSTDQTNDKRPFVADVSKEAVSEMKRAQELARSYQSERDRLRNLQASMASASASTWSPDNGKGQAGKRKHSKGAGKKGKDDRRPLQRR